VLPYQLFNIEGVRVAVVGLVPPHIPMWEASSPSHFKGLEFLDPITVLRETVDSLKGKYDVLVGAFHLGRNGEYGSTGGVIEIAPLAFMRGRTLNDAFIILDEAQNTTVEQMKMFLTRLGFGSTAVITGDATQIDLPKGTMSGLKHAARILEGVEGISFTRFAAQDVVRHPLVQRIVEAYAAAEQPTDHPTT